MRLASATQMSHWKAVPFLPGTQRAAGNVDLRRRRYRRVQAPVRCCPVGTGFFVQHLDFVDVSLEGLRIFCDHEYLAGTRIHLDIVHDGIVPLAVTTEVLWVKRLGENTPARFGIGLSLVEVSTAALTFLMSVIDSEVESLDVSHPKAEPVTPTTGEESFDLGEPVSEVHSVTPAQSNDMVALGRPTGPHATADASDEHDRPTVRPSQEIQAFANATTARSFEREPPFPPDRCRPPLSEPEKEFPSITSALLGAIDASAGARKSERMGDDPIEEMRECFSSGDYAGALAMTDRVLAAQPDHALARAFRTDCLAALEDVFAFRLGSLDRVPVVVTPPADTEGSPVDHRTGFLLHLIDGSTTLEAIVDVCGMPRTDALRILCELVQRGTVVLG
jgi:hypothetical protein